MALQITIPYQHNLEITYWSVEEIQIDFEKKEANIRVAGYLSEEAKNLDKDTSISNEWYNFRGDDFTFTKEGNNVAEAYKKVKAYYTTQNIAGKEVKVYGMFKEAEDC